MSVTGWINTIGDDQSLVFSGFRDLVKSGEVNVVDAAVLDRKIHRVLHICGQLPLANSVTKHPLLNLVLDQPDVLLPKLHFPPQLHHLVILIRLGLEYDHFRKLVIELLNVLQFLSKLSYNF